MLKETSSFESSLRHEGQRRIAEIGTTDLLIGVPSYKNEQTIGLVIDRIAEGLQTYHASLRPVIAIVDGGSSDETVRTAMERPLPHDIRRLATTYQGIPGKGSAVRAIFEMTRTLKAKACVVLEADLTSLTREWVHKLAAPVLSGEYDFVVPRYARPLVEDAVTDILAYPLTRLLYDVNLRQPMGGDLGASSQQAMRS